MKVKSIIIDGKYPVNNLRITWHCSYYRRTKNKPDNQNKFYYSIELEKII